jgi:hypothetical protein
MSLGIHDALGALLVDMVALVQDISHIQTCYITIEMVNITALLDSVADHTDVMTINRYGGLCLKNATERICKDLLPFIDNQHPRMFCAPRYQTCQRRVTVESAVSVLSNAIISVCQMRELLRACVAGHTA